MDIENKRGEFRWRLSRMTEKGRESSAAQSNRFRKGDLGTKLRMILKLVNGARCPLIAANVKIVGLSFFISDESVDCFLFRIVAQISHECLKYVRQRLYPEDRR